MYDTGSVPSSRQPFSFEKYTAAAAMEGFGVSLNYIGELHSSGIKQIAELRGVEYVEGAIPKAIVDALRRGEADETRSVIAELGRCASRQPWSQELASDAAGQVLGAEDPYGAIPALKALSTLAVHRVALDQNPVGPHHLAEPPAFQLMRAG
jgi:hypothetical protein